MKHSLPSPQHRHRQRINRKRSLSWKICVSLSMSRVPVPLSGERLWIYITFVIRRPVRFLRSRGRGLLLMRIWCRILFRCILRGIGRLPRFWIRRFLLGIWLGGFMGPSFAARFWLMRCSVMLVWVFFLFFPFFLFFGFEVGVGLVWFSG